jgi:hypothetical protein
VRVLGEAHPGWPGEPNLPGPLGHVDTALLHCQDLAGMHPCTRAYALLSTISGP